MKIERYFKLIFKKWWIIALLEIIALAATFYYVSAQPQTYTSTTTLILNPKNSNPIIPYTNPDTSSADSLADSYNLVLKSDTFLVGVQKLLDFEISLDDLKKSFTSKLTPGSLSYYISSTTGSPQRSLKIANAVTTAFLANQTNKSSSTDQANTTTTLQTQKDQLATLNNDIAALNAQIADLKKQPSTQDVQDKLTTLNTQLRALLDSQAQAVLAIGQLEQQTTSSTDTNYALLLNPAKLPTQPDPTNLARNLIFAFALALALGIGVILLLNYLDTSVRSEEDLVELTGTTPLAKIPEIELFQHKELDGQADGQSDKGTATAGSGARAIQKSDSKLSEMLVTIGLAYSPAAEAYRSLRTTILFSNQAATDGTEKPASPSARSFLVTSALPHEGRTLTAANLAITFAQTGKKVILIDSDLRHPSLHLLFDIPNEIGFSDLALSGITKLTKAVHSTSIPNLVVVTAGKVLSSPSELLTSSKTNNVIKFFKNIADIVIFDSPPVSMVSDAAILSHMVDQVILVVEDKITERTAIASTILELKKVGAKVEGIVVNRVKPVKSKSITNYFNFNNNAAQSKTQSDDKLSDNPAAIAKSSEISFQNEPFSDGFKKGSKVEQDIS